MTFYQGGLTVRRVPIFAAVLAGFFVADPVALKIQGPDTVGNAVPFALSQTGNTNVTPTVLSSSNNNANAATNSSLAASVGVTNYITGFEVTGTGATAGSQIAVQLQGTVGGTLNYTLIIPTGAGVSITPLIVTFNPALPATATNTAITVTVPAFGAGSTQQSTVVHGYRQ